VIGVAVGCIVHQHKLSLVGTCRLAVLARTMFALRTLITKLIGCCCWCRWSVQTDWYCLPWVNSPRPFLVNKKLNKHSKKLKLCDDCFCRCRRVWSAPPRWPARARTCVVGAVAVAARQGVAAATALSLTHWLYIGRIHTCQHTLNQLYT